MTSIDYKIIIPARKNSKRLRGKNLKVLDGKPLISHSIEYALKFFNANNIWINTDDIKITKIANSYGIRSYKRRPELALDNTLIGEVIYDHCKFFLEQKIDFQNIIVLQPTNPIRDNIDITKIIQVFQKEKLESLMSVSLLKKKIGVINGKKFKPINYNFEQRSQDIDKIFFENGLIYISSKNLILEKKKIISDNVFPYLTDGIGSNIDIDFIEDLQMAEIALKNKL